MAGKNAVAKNKEAGLPAEIQAQMEAFDGAGGEDAGIEDQMIPWIVILQALSPQLNKQKAEYLGPDAEQGMIFNTATEAVFDGEVGVQVIPVFYQRRYTEWIPRKDGGGLVGQHGPEILDETTRSEETGRDTLPNGNEIVTSGDWYVMLIGSNGQPTQAVISFSSTQMKKSRKLMTQLKQLTYERKDGSLGIKPFFNSIVTLQTGPESNESGDWYGWVIRDRQDVLGNPDLPNNQMLFTAGAEMHEGIVAGTLKAAADPGAGGNAAEGDDIPF